MVHSIVPWVRKKEYFDQKMFVSFYLSSTSKQFVSNKRNLKYRTSINIQVGNQQIMYRKISNNSRAPHFGKM